MASGGGAPSRSHSSVHDAEHPRRFAGERTGADRIPRGGGKELSLDRRLRLRLLGGQPYRPTPDALGPQRHRRRDLATAADAAGGEDGRRGHGVDHVGHEDHGPDLAGVAARFGALRHDQIDAGGLVALSVNDAPGEGGDSNARPTSPVDELGRGSAEGAGHEADPMGEGDVEERAVSRRADP